MWAKVTRLASPAPRKASSTPARADEPTFARIYEAVEGALASQAEQQASTDVDSVRRQLEQLLTILRVEAAGKEDGLLGPCVEYALRQGAFARLVELAQRDEPKGVRVTLVEWFSRAVVELDEGFLAHGGVNKPLVKLLRTCVDEDGGLRRDEEVVVVSTMCIVCERIKTRPELLAIFLRQRTGSRKPDQSPALAPTAGRRAPLTRLSSLDENGRPTSPTLSQVSASDVSTSISASNASSSTSRRQRSERDFLLYAYLLRFIHREGLVGDSARRGILCLCDVALGYPDVYAPSFSHLPRSTSTSTITPSTSRREASSASTREAVLAFAEYLLDSDFAEVLGAGIGALYGLLPSKLVVRAPGPSGGGSSGAVDPMAPQRATGMVLGGMGALGEEEDAEELERKREEEEDRLRSMGVGFSGSKEVRDGIDGFLKLVEFTQEVLKRCSESIIDEDPDAGQAVDEMDDARQRNLLLSALTSSILSAVRDLFLQLVLYPSILECSETDGSAVAVLSYLEALLDVVGEGTQLEGAILSFLLGEDDSPLERSRRPSSSPSPRFATRVKPRKSSALLLIEQNSARHDRTSLYFTSSGRFSLRDLLTSHIHSSSEQTATAALKLLQTVLTRHDRWSLALLDVVLDQGATSFPRAVHRAPDTSAEQARLESSAGAGLGFKSDSSSDDDDSDEDFVYPTSASPRPPRWAGSTSIPDIPSTPSGSGRVKPYDSPFGPVLESLPSIARHLDSLDTLLSLLGSIDPAYRRNRSMGGGTEMLSSAFSNYLRDAEASLVADRGFRRGVETQLDDRGPSDDAPLPQTRRSTLFGLGQAWRGRDFARTRTGWRHKVKPSGEVASLLLDSVSHFFSNSPDVNLALTAVLSALATSPYRSLDGWMLPVVRNQSRPTSDYEQFLERGRTGRSRSSDDGDDRSIDFEIEERSRHDALLSPKSVSPPNGWTNPPASATRAALPQSDSLLSILSALVESVEGYRRRIPNFDTYLSERRQGLFFVENLAEALELDDLVSSDLSSLELEPKAVPARSAPPETPVSKSKPSPGIGGGLVSFFSPRRPSHNRTPSTPVNFSYSTPPHPSSAPSRPSQLRRSASNDSLASPAPSGLAVPSTIQAKASSPASPFVAHYRKTGSIAVEPVIVGTPAQKRHRLRASSGIPEDDNEDDEDGASQVEGQPDSPSRRLSPLPPATEGNGKTSTASSSNGSFSTSSSPAASRVKSAKPTPSVTLSTVLDNVIVLEEFVKELAAIVFVRRSVGIDAVRFV
ncbi:hypothetical protein JCM10212_004616 [Sporobolomyces blumeae]